MQDLVTLDEAKAHCRVVADDDDDYLSFLISSASQSVIRYLGDGAADWLDSGGNLISESSAGATIPEPWRMAVLFLVGVHYANRDGVGEATTWQAPANYLPSPVVALLYPYRDPACQ